MQRSRLLPSLSKTQLIYVDYVYSCSWRNVYDRLDFGQGGPTVKVGTAAPHILNLCPARDGVFCALKFHEEDFERLQASRLLQNVAPEARFVKACNSPA